MKYVAIDFETTGIDANVNQPLSFCAVITFMGDKTPIDKLPKFHCRFIWDVWTIHYRAHEINNTLIQRLVTRNFDQSYIEPDKFKNQFRYWLNLNGCMGKIVLAGKNPAFDASFLRALNFTDFDFRMIDPAILYMLPEDNNVPGLATCLRRAKFDSSGIHDESFDAEAVVKLLRNFYD